MFRNKWRFAFQKLNINIVMLYLISLCIRETSLEYSYVNDFVIRLFDVFKLLTWPFGRVWFCFEFGILVILLLNVIYL